MAIHPTTFVEVSAAAHGVQRRINAQLEQWRASRLESSRVRHRFSDAVAVMAFSAAASAAGALLLTALTWWATRTGA